MLKRISMLTILLMCTSLISSCSEKTDKIQPETIAESLTADPVIQRINQRIPELKTNINPKNTGTIKWILGPNVSNTYKKFLEEQSTALAEVFPLTYHWDGTATLIVGDVLTWPTSEIKIENQCKNFVKQMIDRWKNLPGLDNRILGGSSYCNGESIIVIRPNPSTNQPDADLMAQEIGVQIQLNSIKNNPKITKLNLNEIVIPDWYMQGGQSANAFIAFIGKNKSTTGVIDKVFVSSECKTVSLNQMRPENKLNAGITNCDYSKGFASVRLMIAIYGWDATVKWFSGFSSANDYEEAFLISYGQTLDQFEFLADVYWNYLIGIKTDTKKLTKALNALS